MQRNLERLKQVKKKSQLENFPVQWELIRILTHKLKSLFCTKLGLTVGPDNNTGHYMRLSWDFIFLS